MAMGDFGALSCGVVPGSCPGQSAGRLLFPVKSREAADLPALLPAVLGQLPQHCPAALPPAL